MPGLCPHSHCSRTSRTSLESGGTPGCNFRMTPKLLMMMLAAESLSKGPATQQVNKLAVAVGMFCQVEVVHVHSSSPVQ